MKTDAAELSPAMRERYGIRPTSPWTIAAIAALTVAFLGLIGAITWQLAKPSVQTQLVRFTVDSDNLVNVTFDLQRDTSATTTCALRARDVHQVDVGYATFTIPPGRAALRVTYPLATLAKATSAEVLGCADNSAPHVDAPAFAPGTVNPPQQPTVNGG
jgi:hypothetical protein